MIVNKVDMDLIQEGIVPDMMSIVNNATTPIAGFIQMDKNIRISTNRGVPVATQTGTPVHQLLQEISERITSQEIPATVL